MSENAAYMVFHCLATAFILASGVWWHNVWYVMDKQAREQKQKMSDRTTR